MTKLRAKKVFGIREVKGFICLYFPRDYLQDAIDNFPKGKLLKNKAMIVFSPLLEPNIKEKLVIFVRKYNAIYDKKKEENLAKRSARLEGINMTKIFANKLIHSKQFYKAGYAAK